MKRSVNELIAHGVLGGMLAGLVVVLWFFVVDALAGQPFHTPAALAGALTNQQITAPTLRVLGAYTIVHFGVFAALGIGAAWALHAMRLRPGLLLGVLFGIVVQECAFYAGMLLSGTAPSEMVSWKHVIGANLLSGMVLMAYLHRATRDEQPFGLATLSRYPSLSRGIVTGLIGAAAVAVWFLALDVIAGQPLRTPSALGSALLFGGPTDGAAVNVALVAAYSVVHVIAFAVAGVIFVAIAEQVERAPSLLLLAGMTAIVLEAAAVATIALTADWVLGALGIWSVVLGNLVAVACMGWYVWQTHPGLRRQLRGEPVSMRV